ncbi:chaperonin 10-like protein [Aspergillus recurvatus]
MASHLAAILHEQATPLTVEPRATPSPGPGELLLEVKAIAINPADASQRDNNIPPIPVYPAVIGCDVAGIVVKAGTDFPASAPQPGTRVVALASSFFKEGKTQYGAFQQFVLTSYQCVTSLPATISFEEGAVFPLATLTALSGFATVGIPLDKRFAPEEKKAVLLWGGASSVGTIAIQFARQMGFILYTTASPSNHKYLNALGAHRTFDYSDADVVSQIVAAAREDGVRLTDAQTFARNSLQPILDVLKETKGDGPARVGHAAPLLSGAPSLKGVEVKFVMPPMEPTAQAGHFNEVFQGWLKPGLENGTVVPSPRVKVIEGGLEGLNAALDMMKQGVSATKLVVKV